MSRPSDPPSMDAPWQRRLERLRKPVLLLLALAGAGAATEILPGPAQLVVARGTGPNPQHAYIVADGSSYAVSGRSNVDVGTIRGEIYAMCSSDEFANWQWCFPTRRVKQTSFSYTLGDGRALSESEAAALRQAFADYLATQSPLRRNPRVLGVYMTGLQRPNGTSVEWLWSGTLGNAVAVLAGFGIVRVFWRSLIGPRAHRKREGALRRGRCPHCGYELRDLTTMRCPECGRRWLERELDICDPDRRWSGLQENTRNSDSPAARGTRC